MLQQVELGEGTRYGKVKLSELVTDGRFNRPVSESWVVKIAEDFQSTAFGTIEVASNEDGTYTILDGQTRVGALKRMGVPEDKKCVPAKIHDGLEQSERALTFVTLNASRFVKAYDKYRALLAAKHEETMAIDRLVRSFGLVVTNGKRDSGVSAVAALQKTYRMGEPFGDVLDATLRTLQSAWGDIADAYDGRVIEGLAVYFHESRDASPLEVAKAIVNGPGAPIGLIGQAKLIAGGQRMSVPRAIAYVLEHRLMKRKQSRPRKVAKGA